MVLLICTRAFRVASPLAQAAPRSYLSFVPCSIFSGAAERAMGWSVNIGSIAGTAIRIHITFILFLVWIFVASWIQGGPAAAWNGLAFLILLFACVLAHE